MRKCWDIKGCPASHYLQCPAYEQKVDCWEIRLGCLCHVYQVCDICPIYNKHLKDMEEQA